MLGRSAGAAGLAPPIPADTGRPTKEVLWALVSRSSLELAFWHSPQCLVIAYVGQLGWTTFGPKPAPLPTPVPSATPTPQAPYVINYYVAPSAEDYFRQAAVAYNKEHPRSADGRAQEVKGLPRGLHFRLAKV